MELDEQQCYAAMKARDARFDGHFFVAVETTGIYCRPICPARLPARAHCRFYARAAQAERDGFRACLRCRPELAPGHASVDARSQLVARASAAIEAGYLDEHSVAELAAALAVSPRHLRRTMQAELGVAPGQLAQTRRLAVAKQLLQDTRLPLAQVAFAAGYASVRRFNAAVRARFDRPPSALRGGGTAVQANAGSFELRLDYRPPLDRAALLAFMAARAIPGLEQVIAGGYQRSVAIEGQRGWLEVRFDPRRPRLRARLSVSLAPVTAAVVARLRALFDLDAAPGAIAERLARDPLLAPGVRSHPGLRVPGAFDRFELAVRAVLGQQVSVAAARTLAARLVEGLGTALDGAPAGLERCFPTAERVADCSLAKLRALGLPSRRADSLRSLARAVASGKLKLELDAPTVMPSLLALPGIGPWTANYIAMRALGWPDAFVAGDLIVRRSLACESAAACERRAEPWRPWRAYAALHLWTRASEAT